MIKYSKLELKNVVQKKWRNNKIYINIMKFKSQLMELDS